MVLWYQLYGWMSSMSICHFGEKKLWRTKSCKKQSYVTLQIFEMHTFSTSSFTPRLLVCIKTATPFVFPDMLSAPSHAWLSSCSAGNWGKHERNSKNYLQIFAFHLSGQSFTVLCLVCHMPRQRWWNKNHLSNFGDWSSRRAGHYYFVWLNASPKRHGWQRGGGYSVQSSAFHVE